MVLGKRIDSDAESDQVQSNRAGSSVMAPGRSYTCLQIGQETDPSEHFGCVSSLQEQGCAAGVQLGADRLSQIVDAEEVADAPEQRAGFQELFSRTGSSGILDVNSCA